MRTRTMSLIAGLAAVAGAAGCYTTDGQPMPYTGAPYTYYSTEQLPLTVTIVDTRTGEPFWTLEVPVGKQFTVVFDKGKGDDPVLTPDLMRYAVFPIGTTIGRLRDGVTVPDQYSRRLDVEYRHAPEYAQGPKGEKLRTDEAEDRPAWWTTEGGPMPKSATSGADIYDH